MVARCGFDRHFPPRPLSLVRWSVFSHLCCPLVGLFGESVCAGPLPVFLLLDCLSGVAWCEFSGDFDSEALIGDLVCTCLIRIGLSFCLIDHHRHRQQRDEVSG